MSQYKEKIIELRKQGKKYSEIKEILGCSKGTVSYYLSKNTREKAGLRYRTYREKTRDYAREIKSSTPCVDCKIQYPYYVMDFDHIKKDKKNNVAKFIHSGSFENAKKEIKKCEVVCSNCHRKRTWNRLKNK
jgi:predicted transcriptional regulator